MRRIGETYFAPNKDLFGLRRHPGDLDPLCDFSRACRAELEIARR